jgi:hypothetical protein
MGREAAPLTPEEVAARSIDIGKTFGGKPDVDPNAVTPATRTLPPQGDYVKAVPAADGRTGHYLYKGLDGIPFRSVSPKAPDIKNTDPKKPAVVWDAHARVFNLGDVNDLRAYTEIFDGAYKHRVKVCAEDRQWSPEAKTWFAFVRWGVAYWEIPS